MNELIATNLALKEECIKKKKAIAYCRRRINRGLPVDPERMKTEIEQEMRLCRGRNRDVVTTEDYAEEEHKAMLEEERDDYERCLEILQKTLDDILASI